MAMGVSLELLRREIILFGHMVTKQLVALMHLGDGMEERLVIKSVCRGRP